jgi:LPS sulfotransferase NodH
MSVRRIIEATKKPGKVGRFVKYKLLSTFGSSNFRPFIVLTRARTGSNLLISMLDSHPNIRAEGELFRDLGPRFYGFALSMVFSKQPRHIRASGFKIFYNHTSNDGRGGVWGKLCCMDDLLVIQLGRRNALRTMTSRKIAGAQGVWLASASETYSRREKGIKSINFTAEELEYGFVRMRAQEEWAEETFGRHARIHVYYEDLVDNSEHVLRGLTTYLGLPYHAPKTSLIKQNPEKLSELISNYDELKAKFTGTEWQRYFED